MNHWCRLPAGLLLGLLCFVPAFANPLEGLDEWIENERERWSIPGLMVAVVHEDKVIYARGFGHLALDRERQVDGDTTFGIASLSKAMTTTALGILVDEGQLDWDDRVIDHLPGFRLSDDWVTGQVTVRDLLGHRVGVGRLTGNRLTFMPAVTRAEFIAQLRHHEFEQPFRQGFVYSNAMYTVAGQLIEAISGQPWEAFVAERLFAPLGMTRSSTDNEGLDDNAARPHQQIDGEIVEIAHRSWGYAAPAAAVNSTAHDLARWMRFNLGVPGALDDERLVSERTMQAIRQPANLGDFDEDERSVSAYALGWSLSRYRGHHVLGHGGSSDGINSRIWLIPELELGIVVSANMHTLLREPLIRHIVDQVTGGEPTAWSEQMFAEFEQDRADARAAREAVHARRRQEIQPSHALSDYAGSYSDGLYDSAEVIESDDGLEVRFWNDDDEVLALEHWQLDTFRGHWRNPAKREKFAWFTMDENGQPNALNVRFTLRPKVLEEGIYPADYTRVVRFKRVDATDSGSAADEDGA